MKRFSYKAKGKNGVATTGTVEAETSTQAAKLIREKNLVVLSVRQTSGSMLDFAAHINRKISPAEVATFTRQLATMVGAGLPLSESLGVLRSQTQGPMQKTIARILADIENGEALSTAFSKHERVFSPTYVALIKSGEIGGVLDAVLARVSDDLEKKEEFKGKVKGALTYPAIIVGGMIVVGFVMMLFVIPRLTSLYTQFDRELPVPTKILITVSGMFLKYWLLVLVVLGMVAYGFILYRRTKVGRRKIDELMLKIPLLGNLQRQVVLTDLTRTLGLMVGSGVSILESLAITAKVVKNTVISSALVDSARQVEKGFPLAYAFAKHPEAFPFILSQMVAVGEETGKMDEIFSKTSHVFEVESDQKVKVLTSSIEPMVMIILGVGVAFLVIAVILPIYDFTSGF